MTKTKAAKKAKKVDAEASADAKTLRHSKPTPDDDEVVHEAASRLSRRAKKRGKRGQAGLEVPSLNLEEGFKITHSVTEFAGVLPPAVVEDTAHSLAPEKIADERVTHDDERPPNSDLSVPEVISRAWDEVKGAGDPPLRACVPSHVEKFLAHGERILTGSAPLEGDTLLARFEQAVLRLKTEQMKES